MAVTLVIFPASYAPADTLNVSSRKHASIQDAIDAASNGDEIVVAPGTYNEKINFNGKAITVRSSDGPGVTIIDGTGLNDSVVKCVSGEGPDTILRGFTITGGTGEPTVVFFSVGGGMLNKDSSPTVIHCAFTQNTVFGEVGGHGGGMYNKNSSPTVTNCAFTINSASSGGVGGGMYSENSSPTVTNCMFSGNIAGHGGGMDIDFTSSPTVTNCTFSGNTAGSRGGGILIANGSPTITNCILSNNVDSGGMDESAQIHLIGSGTAVVTYSLIQGLDTFAGGTGNIDADPLFVDAPNGDLRLSPGSPCIDVGSNPAFMTTAAPLGATVDLDGNPRFMDDPAASDTGVGLGLIIDMGVFEFGGDPADFNHDGRVDLRDFAEFLTGFTGP